MEPFGTNLFIRDMLASAALVAAWLIAMRMLRYSGWRIALISLAGTIAHELLHGIVGLLLGARPVGFSLIPKRQGRSWILGSVSFSNIHILNAAPVAFAPLLLLPIAAYLSLHWMLPALASGHYGMWIAFGYLVASCAFSCVPSMMDIRLGALSALLYGAVAFLIWWMIRSPG